MTFIGNLIDNIQKYGNCQVYYKAPTGNSKINRVLDFDIDINGELVVSGYINTYDKQFWNGENFNESASIEYTNKVFSCSYYDRMDKVLSCIVMESILGKEVGITSRKVKTASTDIATWELYRLANSMLSLSNEQITKLVLSDSDLVLMEQASKRVEVTDFNPEEASSLVDEKVISVSERYNDIKRVYNGVNSVSSIEEYLELDRKKIAYCTDSTSLCASYVKK